MGYGSGRRKYRQSIEHLALMRVAMDYMVLRGIIAKPYYTRGAGMPDIIGSEQGSIIRVECETGSKEYMPISGTPTSESIKLVLEAQLRLHRLFANAPKATPRGKTPSTTPLGWRYGTSSTMNSRNSGIQGITQCGT